MSEGADTEPGIRISLRVVDDHSGPKSPFATLSAVFSAERVQPRVSAGISFWLEIGNGSAQALNVQNPLEGLQVSLLDGKGWPVRLPLARPPRAMIHPPRPRKLILPYQLLGISEMESGRDLVSITDDLNWTLPAQETIRFGITIDRIVPKDEANPATQTALVSVTEGLYRIKLMLLLISASAEAGYRIFQMDSPPLKLGED